MEPLPQKELAALLGDGCFLRRAKDDGALFVTDAPRRFAPEKLSAVEAALKARGFCCSLTPRALWRVDLAQARYVNLFTAYRYAEPPPFPADERLMRVYALARLLAAHPAPWEEQPPELLRALLKRCGRPAELLQIAPRVLETCARSLREHRPLPSAAAGMLYQWLTETGKG